MWPCWFRQGASTCVSTWKKKKIIHKLPSDIFSLRKSVLPPNFIYVSDELRHILGTDTVKIGAGRIFDMFQYRSLNRRLVYVCLEGVIETLFPQNKFKEVFRKLHSQSSRLKVLRNEAMTKDLKGFKRS